MFIFRHLPFKCFFIIKKPKDVLTLLFTESLKKNYQFKYVYDKGKSVANRFLVVFVLKNSILSNRLGISVSKKVGNSVIRSRVKRLVKESYRLQESYINRGFDIVVIARNPSKEASFSDIDASVKYLLKKHGMKV